MRRASVWALVCIVGLCGLAHGAPIVVDEAVSHASGFNSFPTVPGLSSSDYADASSGNFVTVATVGSLNGNSGPASVLLNGAGQSGNDVPGESAFLQDGLTTGKFLVNLATNVDVSQVNTYSRHVSNRTPQVYDLFGSNAATLPGTGGDNVAELTGLGWTHIATVDTRAGSTGGSYNGICGVSVSDTSGSLGTYRYLMLNADPPGGTGNTFYGELDVYGTPLSPPQPPAVEVIAHYAFDGDYSNAEGPAPAATPNATTFNTANKKFGSAAVLLSNPIGDNDDARLDIADGAYFQGLESLTVALWVDPSSWQGNPRIFQKGSDSNWRLYSEGTNDLRLIISGHTVTVPDSVFDLIPLDDWTHVAAVFDGLNDLMTIYINGDVANSVSVPFDAVVNNNTSALGIGQKAGGTHANDGYDGLMDELWIFNGALTEEQIESLMSFNRLPEDRIPEPATLGLLALGGLALVRRRRVTRDA